MTYSLELAREKFKDLFELSLDLIYVHDFRGKFLDANEITLEKLGYNREEINNLSFNDLISKDQLTVAFKALTEIRDFGKQITPREYRLKKKNGDFIYIETYGIPLKEDGKIFGIFGIARDITERMIAEQKLKESKEKYRRLVNNITDIIIEEDLNSKILYLSPKIFEILGYQPQELIGSKLYKYIHPKDFPMAVERAKELVNTGKIEALRYRLRHKDGHYVETSAKGTIYKINGKNRYIGVIRDITEQIKATQKLKESEEKYRLISENANDLIAVINQKSKFEYINEKIHIKILGFSKDDFIGKSTSEFIHPDDINNTIKSFKKGFEYGELIDLVRFKDKNGIYHWLEVRGNRFTDQDGEMKILMIARDITEKKEAAQKLKESEEKYRAVVEQANDGIVIIQNDLFKYVNPSFCKMTGYRHEELIDNSYKILVHPEAINEVADRHTRRMVGEDIVKTYDTLLISKNGKRIDVSVNVSVIIYNGKPANLTIFHNITERKKMEGKLKESEEKYRSILENIEEGYFELDLKGNFTFVNEYHSNFLGIPKDKLIGYNYADLVDQKYKKMLFKIFTQVYREEVPSATFDVEVTRYDGVKLIYEGTCNLKLDSNGKKIGFYSLTRDITERKKMEALREKFTEQLKIEVGMKTKELQEIISQQKLYLEQIIKASQFKTEFMGSMSHELRTPLNAIIGFTDLLLESSYGPVNEDQFDFLKDIKSSGEHLLYMIDQILNISRIEAGELNLRFQEINLKSHIAQIKSSIQPMYEKKKLEFEIIGLDTDKSIYADPIRLKEIFYNLLTNAIKFTNKGKITLKILDKEDQWEFQVIDTGIGIMKKNFDLIFKEFKRVESPEVIAVLGSGLGLPITRKLVYMHGGTISFTSEIGKGSTFIFTIPRNIEQKNQELE